MGPRSESPFPGVRLWVFVAACLAGWGVYFGMLIGWFLTVRGS